MRWIYFVLMAAIAAASIRAVCADDIGTEKKIIKFGWDDPSTSFLREHLAQLEQLPFDGTVFYATAQEATGSLNFCSNTWGKRRYTQAELQSAFDDLRAIHPVSFTENLLRFNVTPGDVDWFDPAFESVLENAKLAGALAAAGHVRGILLDTEMYQGQVFTYRGLKSTTEHGFTQTRTQVRERGRQFMGALQTSLANPVVFLTFGTSCVNLPDDAVYEQKAKERTAVLRQALELSDWRNLAQEAYWLCRSASDVALEPLARCAQQLEQAAQTGKMENARLAFNLLKEEQRNLLYQDTNNALLPAFIDGMLEAATGGAQIVDGYELSYAYRDDRQFAQARDKIIAAATMSRVPEQYRQRCSVGFGIYMDQGWNSAGWFTNEPEKNLLTPLEFEYALHRALTYADKYVWVYTEQPNWLDGKNLPAGYREAVAQARKHHDPTWAAARTLPATAPAKITAASVTGHDDQATFSSLWSNYELVMDLPKRCLFRTDPQKQGDTEKWYAPETELSTWKPIELGKFWNEQGYDPYEGVAWYCINAPLPDLPAGHSLWLAFGAVDEQATVYINGRYAGRYGILHHTSNTPFQMEVTPFLKSGAQNVIVVRVENEMGFGGLWKSVKLVARK